MARCSGPLGRSSIPTPSRSFLYDRCHEVKEPGGFKSRFASVSAFADWIYRASAMMRVGVAVAVLTAMTEAALPWSSGCFAVPSERSPGPF